MLKWHPKFYLGADDQYWLCGKDKRHATAGAYQMKKGKQSDRKYCQF